MNLSHVLQPVPARDWITIVVLFIGICLLIGISETIRGYFNWPEEFTRKLVHISVGLLMFFAPILLETSLPLVLIALFFTGFNFMAMRKGLLKGMHGARQSYGTTFYPLAFLILVLVAWPGYKVIIIAAMMVLALGDAVAAIVGETLHNPRDFMLISERKSIEGSVSMFIVSSLVLFLILLFYPFAMRYDVSSPGMVVWIAVLTSLIATVAEALSARGSDNLSVPLFTGLILYFMISHTTLENIQLTLGTLLGALVAILSARAKFLNGSGAVTTFLLAVVVFGFGGWQWALPILTFFVLSSLLSKFGKSIRRDYESVFEKGSQRDYAQVLANGGLAGILMILHMFYQKPSLYIYYLSALAAATADTWATEIGILMRQRPRLISTMRPVSPGTSGGVTLAGILGSLLGALVLTLSGWKYLQTQFAASHYLLLLGVTTSGFLGSLVDSYLGATLQVQYRCPVCQRITEKTLHCQQFPATPVRGYPWLNNDLVNFLNTVSALIFVHLGLKFFF